MLHEQANHSGLIGACRYCNWLWETHIDLTRLVHTLHMRNRCWNLFSYLFNIFKRQFFTWIDSLLNISFLEGFNLNFSLSLFLFQVLLSLLCFLVCFYLRRCQLLVTLIIFRVLNDNVFLSCGFTSCSILSHDIFDSILSFCLLSYGFLNCLFELINYHKEALLSCIDRVRKFS